MFLPFAALAVKVALAKPEITGNCKPTRVHFTAQITSDIPGPVRYTWVRSDKPSSNTFTLNFTAPASLPVTYDWLLTKPAEGWVVLQILSPDKSHSDKARFSVTCR